MAVNCSSHAGPRNFGDTARSGPEGLQGHKPGFGPGELRNQTSKIERVAAMVQLRAGSSADAEALRHHMREQIAGFKAPERIDIVAAPLPCNATQRNATQRQDSQTGSEEGDGAALIPDRGESVRQRAD